jgi:hypothetical protein
MPGSHVSPRRESGRTRHNQVPGIMYYPPSFVHEYGYTIELDEEQRPRFRDPHGWVVVARPPRPIPPDLGWPRIRAQNEELGIDAETNACKWDGKPVHYAAIIDQLVIADGLR